MIGTIHNRDQFLNRIASRLGRERKTELEAPNWKYNPQEEVLKNATQDELLEVLREQCKEVSTNFVLTKKAELADTIKKVTEEYGGGPVIAPKDARFSEYGLDTLLMNDWPKEGVEVHIWDHTKGKENIDKANVANVGIVISDMTLAESGTVVLQSSKDKGRTLLFLPQYSIYIVPKSTIVPRTTQAARMLREKVKNGEHISSCINFITGPSNSADIEMVSIWGVHGPIKVTYVVVDDI